MFDPSIAIGPLGRPNRYSLTSSTTMPWPNPASSTACSSSGVCAPDDAVGVADVRASEDAGAAAKEGPDADAEAGGVAPFGASGGTGGIGGIASSSASGGR